MAYVYSIEQLQALTHDGHKCLQPDFSQASSLFNKYFPTIPLKTNYRPGSDMDALLLGSHVALEKYGLEDFSQTVLEETGVYIDFWTPPKGVENISYEMFANSTTNISQKKAITETENILDKLSETLEGNSRNKLTKALSYMTVLPYYINRIYQGPYSPGLEMFDQPNRMFIEKARKIDSDYRNFVHDLQFYPFEDWAQRYRLILTEIESVALYAEKILSECTSNLKKHPK